MDAQHELSASPAESDLAQAAFDVLVDLADHQRFVLRWNVADGAVQAHGSSFSKRLGMRPVFGSTSVCFRSVAVTSACRSPEAASMLRSALLSEGPVAQILLDDVHA
jgi:hypothetical protein